MPPVLSLLTEKRGWTGLELNEFSGLFSSGYKLHLLPQGFSDDSFRCSSPNLGNYLPEFYLFSFAI